MRAPRGYGHGTMITPFAISTVSIVGLGVGIPLLIALWQVNKKNKSDD